LDIEQFLLADRLTITVYVMQAEAMADLSFYHILKKCAIAPGVQSVAQVAHRLGVSDADWQNTVANTEVPAPKPTKSTSLKSVGGAGSQASAAVTSIFRIGSSVTMEIGQEPVPEAKASSSSSHASREWTATTPYTATIAAAKWLTAPVNHVEQVHHHGGVDEWGSKRRVLAVTVRLAGSGIVYSPGDSIGVCAPNPLALVHDIFNRIKNAHENASSSSSSSAFALSSVLEPSVFKGSKYMDCDDGITLEEFLTYRLGSVYVVLLVSRIKLLGVYMQM
jgi:hypothetical protein